VSERLGKLGEEKTMQIRKFIAALVTVCTLCAGVVADWNVPGKANLTLQYGGGGWKIMGNIANEPETTVQEAFALIINSKKTNKGKASVIIDMLLDQKNFEYKIEEQMKLTTDQTPIKARLWEKKEVELTMLDNCKNALYTSKEFKNEIEKKRKIRYKVEVDKSGTVMVSCYFDMDETPFAVFKPYIHGKILTKKMM